MAVIVKNHRGKEVVLLNPQEKRNKYFCELKHGVKCTNAGECKIRNGKNVKLKDTERAYRSGYLAAQKDSAKAFKSRYPNYKRRDLVVIE